mgnify:CR=1 FL=1
MFSVSIILSFSIVGLILISSCYILHNFMKLADKQLDRHYYERNNTRPRIKEIYFDKFRTNKKDVIIDVECEIIKESDNAQRYLPIKK